MAGRHVDQQIADLAARHRREVLDDGVDVPARDERSRRLDDWPSLEHELAEAARGQLAVNLVAESGSFQ
jgi:hypothetical protein